MMQEREKSLYRNKVPFPDLYRRTYRWKWPIFTPTLLLLSSFVLSFSINARKGEESGVENFGHLSLTFFCEAVHLQSDFPYLTLFSYWSIGKCFHRTCNQVIRNVTPFRCRFKSHTGRQALHFLSSAATAITKVT